MYTFFFNTLWHMCRKHLECFSGSNSYTITYCSIFSSFSYNLVNIDGFQWIPLFFFRYFLTAWKDDPLRLSKALRGLWTMPTIIARYSASVFFFSRPRFPATFVCGSLFLKKFLAFAILDDGMVGVYFGPLSRARFFCFSTSFSSCIVSLKWSN